MRRPTRHRPAALSRVLVVAAALAVAGPAARAAASGDEASALDLVDAHAVDAPKDPGTWHAQLELASQAARTTAGADASSIRLSPSLRHDGVAGGVRWVLDDRLDVLRSDQPGKSVTLNSLREAYVGVRPGADTVVEAGRINVTSGVGTGYNPTDWFRADSVRYAVSADPGTLRINRLGTVLARGQWLWPGGSVTAIAAPRLVSAPSAADWSLDLGATNRDDRFLLAGTWRVAEGLTPQLLLYRDDDAPVQAGFNVNTLLGDSTVAYLEWAGGRSPRAEDAALGRDGPLAFHQQWSVGLTWTSSSQLSITVEYDRDDAAPDRARWRALQASDPATWGRYRRYASGRQALVTRDQPFVRVAWQDLFVKDLDTAALLRIDPIDHSAFAWGQLLWHATDRLDASVQVQLSRGAPRTNYGAADTHRLVQFSLTGYF